MASKNHTIRYTAGNTYSRTLKVSRKTENGTEPYDFTGYDITWAFSSLGDHVSETADVYFVNEEGGEIGFFLSATLTAQLAAEPSQVEYVIVVNLDDDVVLTLLRGRVVNDD